MSPIPKTIRKSSCGTPSLTAASRYLSLPLVAIHDWPSDCLPTSQHHLQTRTHRHHSTTTKTWPQTQNPEESQRRPRPSDCLPTTQHHIQTRSHRHHSTQPNPVLKPKSRTKEENPNANLQKTRRNRAENQEKKQTNHPKPPTHIDSRALPPPPTEEEERRPLGQTTLRAQQQRRGQTKTPQPYGCETTQRASTGPTTNLAVRHRNQQSRKYTLAIGSRKG